MALNKWNTNFRLEYSVRKTQDYTFSDVQLLPEISIPLERPCSLYHLLSNGIFRKRFVNDKQPLFQLSHFNSLLGCAFPFPTLPCLTLPYYFSSSPPGLFRKYFYSGTKVFSRERTRGLFLECPGNFSGQGPVSRKSRKFLESSIVLHLA